MKKPILFIGGIADGKRLPDPGHPYWKVLTKPSPPSFRPSSHEEFTVVREELYRRVEFPHGEVLYAHSSITEQNLIGTLLRGYAPQTDNQHPIPPWNQTP